VLFRGSSGVGKSFLLQRCLPLLAHRKVVRVSRDELWTQFFHEPRFDEVEKHTLDDAVHALTAHLAGCSHLVLVDGCTFARAAVLERFAAINPALAIVECDCSRATAEARLAQDVGKHPIATRGPALYMQNRARMEPHAHDTLQIDTDGNVDANARAVVAHIRARVDMHALGLGRG